MCVSIKDCVGVSGKNKEEGRREKTENQCVSPGECKAMNSTGLTGCERDIQTPQGRGRKMETELPSRPSATEEMLFLEARQGMRMLQVRPGQALGRVWSTWLVVGRVSLPLGSPVRPGASSPSSPRVHTLGKAALGALFA